ncbi:hypothetical protein AMJ48_00015 [Parcubacteria bacterium DG_74_1]|nr:MAG: hypothetical protein AMJ48_00015 [Parcubacteria bacterium DG_74_1]
MSQNDNGNLISIDDVIFRAKSRGVDFGKGDPRERLRYLTKIGLLPHAKRKSFNGQPPNGAYPEYIIELLSEIDGKLKAGKSIQELKKEKERKDSVETPYVIYPSIREEKKAPSAEVQPSVVDVRHLIPKITTVLKVVFLVLFFGGATFFLIGQAVKQNFYSYFAASFDWARKIAQEAATPTEETLVAREIFLPTTPEPYLTINAETDINAPLNVKEEITTPALNLSRNEFGGTLSSAELTTDRTYTFPNLSGVVCLDTGNCFVTEGQVSSSGGIQNRLAKFLSSNEIGISSIEDFYAGVALTIDSDGRLGVGVSEPSYSLDVAGRIQATGDICTDLVGGRCLSTLAIGGGGGGRAGIGGSGTSGYLPIWTDSTALGDSIIHQAGSVIDVAGTVRMLGFQLPTGASSTYVLTSDASGIGTWQALPPGVLPGGTANQTLRHNGANWVANSFLYNTGSALGIGTTSTLATLTLSGDAIFATTTLPQLVLRHSAGNDLSFAIDGDQSLIEASKRLVLNSLTGEIRLGSNVNIFDAFDTEIRGATFVSTTTDSTVRKSGELVFRASLPIFRFAVPAQTSSTDPEVVSKTFSSAGPLASTTPPQLPGTNRTYAFLINFADNIATTSSSTWRIFKPVASTTYSTFELQGQDLSSLGIGNPYLTATTTLPGDNDWQLDVRVPSADRSIRIFNVFLLVFDQIT